MFVKFQLFSTNIFGDKRGSQMYIGGAAPVTGSLAQKVSHPKKVFDPT